MKLTNVSGKERNEFIYLFILNDAHFIQLYGVRHMVKDHSDSERGNSLPSHRLLFPNSSKGRFFYLHHPTDMWRHLGSVQ